MNRENILKLARHVRNLHVNQFDMRRLHDALGSPRNLEAHAVHFLLGLEVWKKCLADPASHWETHLQARRALGLSKEDSTFVFTSATENMHLWPIQVAGALARLAIGEDPRLIYDPDRKNGPATWSVLIDALRKNGHRYLLDVHVVADREFEAYSQASGFLTARNMKGEWQNLDLLHACVIERYARINTQWRLNDEGQAVASGTVSQ